MSCRRTLILLAGVLGVLACACSRSSRRPVERLAVPPFENLSDDASLGWVGWALSEVAVTETSGSGRLHTLRVAGERNLAASGATSALRGYITVRGGRLRVHATREDLTSRRLTGTFDAEEEFPGGVLRMGSAIARWLEPNASPFDTRSVEALQAFAEARAAEDPAEAAKAFERSIALDPDFGAPYLAWGQALVLRGDRAGAKEIVAKARARGQRLSELRRAELDLLASALSGDSAGRRRALVALSHATPADADVLRQLASEESAARRYDAAAEFYRKAALLDPLNGPTLNQLGYTEALRRNLEGARSALLEYARLEPNNANPSDSLGDVHYHLGAFQDAEKYYLDAYEKDPSFRGGAEFYRAARARLMTGDVPGADELFRRYAEVRRAAQDPFAGYCQSQWLFLSGRRRDAVAQMTRVAASSRAPDVLSLAASQLALWSLEAGSRAEAAAWTAKASAASASPSSQRLVALCQALISPSARPVTVSEDQREGVAAVGFLLAKQFADAIPGLKMLVTKSNPMGSERTQVLLAWALVETGRVQDAAPLLATYGVPPPGLEEPLAGLSFPRLFQLKALVLEKEGRLQEAAQMREVFRKLSGG